MAATWDEIETIFLNALERPPEERGPYLEHACGGDRALRAEIDAMLAAHDDDASMQIEQRLLSNPDGEDGRLDDRSGERVGVYRLLSRIGSGGMGDVYLGERDDDAYRRRVAIKLVRAGYPGLLDARFRRERDILARLDHPHIARLYDGGTTDTGASFLVMEYVDGAPITSYCDSAKLPVRERLRLFGLVCRAVQAAHERLIVHRDLKPSNILVAPDGTPRLLDFGIARILDSESEAGAQTRALDQLMTPEHAAPEQIRGEPAGTTTDVYGLGVLLYELLTGDRPLHFPTRSPAEIERIAEQEDPLPPSRRALSVEGAAAIAVARGTDARGLARILHGDLDAITLTALRKEPERRYGTAGALAEDIERHLTGQPVRARPDTAHYRAAKFVRRNRVAVALATLTAVLLAGFAIVSTSQARRVTIERDRARTERARTEQVLATLVQLFESTRPENMPGGDTLRVSTFLDHGARMVSTLDAPARRAELFSLLASIRRERGEIREAGALIDSALAHAPDAKERTRLLLFRAVLIRQRDGNAAAEPLLRESLKGHRMLYGPLHAEVATAMAELANAVVDPDDRRRLHEESLAMRRTLFAPDDPAIASSLNALGAVSLSEGSYDAARERFEEAAAILSRSGGAGEGNRLTVDHNLASVYGRLGEWDRAVQVQKRILAAKLRLHGDGGLPVAGAWEALGVSQTNLRRFDEAAEAFARALGGFEASLSPGHWRLANAARNVGQILALQERYGEGLVYIERAIAGKASTGEIDASLAYMRGQRAMMWLGLGRTGQALTEIHRVLADIERLSEGRERGYLADAHVWLGTAYLEADDPASAGRHFEAALAMREKSLPQGHPRIAEARCGLAVSLVSRGLRADAAPLLAAARDPYLAWGLAHPLLRRRVEAIRPQG